MKFIFADSLDFIDPNYDFLADRHGSGRKPYWDDAYPHEILGYAPYDGILVSRGIVGDGPVKGKYTDSQAMRFRRVGARTFLRVDRPEFATLSLFGDCGAFSYVNQPEPPYTPNDTVAFYDDCGFTHGCSVDHIIFDFLEDQVGMAGATEEAQRRFDLTLANAETFLKEAAQSGRFKPLGVIQGWSPQSMAAAARSLVAMGYDYLAIGGMVPLKIDQIARALAAIRNVVPPRTRLHILGFGKANEMLDVAAHGVTSFDTTSPMIRAFKDDKQNYWSRRPDGSVGYYTAIRVPQALENPRLQKQVKQGDFRAEDLSAMETAALDALRAYDRREAEVDDVLESVLTFNAVLAMGRPYEEVRRHPAMLKLESRYRVTLNDRPWARCSCRVCTQAGVEVVVFRASNRNKRRGIHNLTVFKSVLDDLTRTSDNAA